jgi:hypothetical protein
MTIWLLLCVAVAVLTGSWAFFHRPGWWSVALYPALFLAIVGSTVDILGAAKPLRLEWRVASEWQVLSYHLDEGVGIYVWLVRPGETEPRAYRLPWDVREAEKLQQAARDAAEGGGRLSMRVPQIGLSLDTDPPQFYSTPWPAPPLKEAPTGLTNNGGM